MAKINTYIQNVILEKGTGDYQEPWINPHIDYAEQLGYYGLTNTTGSIPETAQMKFSLFCEDSLGSNDANLMNFYVFVLNGKDLINYVRNSPTRFLTSYLFSTNKITIPGVMTADATEWANGITYIKRQILYKNLIVNENQLQYFDKERMFSNDYLNSRQWSITNLISSTGESDLSILYIYGSSLENIDSLRQLNFKLEDIIGKIFSINILDILKDNEIVPDNGVFVQDARQQEKFSQLWSGVDTLTFSTVKERMDSNVLTLFSRQSEWFKENTFSDICLSRIDNNYGYYFSFDIKKILQNESTYFNILNKKVNFTNNYVIDTIVSNSSIIEMKIVRQRVRVNPSVNELAVPIFTNSVFDDTWDEGIEEFIAIAGDTATGLVCDQNYALISEMNINDNSGGKIRNFNGLDLTIKNKTNGYYRLGVYLTIKDGTQKFLQDLFFDLKKQYRWFTEYYEDIINSNIIDSRTGFLKPIAVRRMNAKYGRRPPWESIVSSLRSWVTTLTTVTPELEQVLLALQTWIKPDSATESSLSNFVIVVDNLINSFNSFLSMAERNENINVQHWFNEQVMDAEYDKTTHMDLIDINFTLPDKTIFPHIDSNKILEVFTNSTLMDGAFMVMPNKITCGDIKSDLSLKSDSDLKFGTNVLSIISANKIVGGLNHGSSGANASQTPSEPSKTQKVIDSTIQTSGQALGTFNITLKPVSLNVSAPQPTTISGESLIVTDYIDNQITGTKNKIGDTQTNNIESQRKLSQDLMENVLVLSPKIAPKVTGKSNVRFTLDSVVNVDKYRPQLELKLPELSKGLMGIGDYMLDEIYGVQYCSGYNIGGDGEIDIKNKKWNYLRPDKIQELVNAENKPFLCRLYKETQQARVNQLDVPINNEFFFLYPTESSKKFIIPETVITQTLGTKPIPKNIVVESNLKKSITPLNPFIKP